jgi:hypothetical protein
MRKQSLVHAFLVLCIVLSASEASCKVLDLRFSTSSGDIIEVEGIQEKLKGSYYKLNSVGAYEQYDIEGNFGAGIQGKMSIDFSNYDKEIGKINFSKTGSNIGDRVWVPIDSDKLKNIGSLSIPLSRSDKEAFIIMKNWGVKNKRDISLEEYLSFDNFRKDSDKFVFGEILESQYSKSLDYVGLVIDRKKEPFLRSIMLQANTDFLGVATVGNAADQLVAAIDPKSITGQTFSDALDRQAVSTSVSMRNEARVIIESNSEFDISKENIFGELVKNNDSLEKIDTLISGLDKTSSRSAICRPNKIPLRSGAFFISCKYHTSDYDLEDKYAVVSKFDVRVTDYANNSNLIELFVKTLAKQSLERTLPNMQGFEQTGNGSVSEAEKVMLGDLIQVLDYQ